MLLYPILEWILFFYIYAIIGWIFETTYVSLKKRKFINRGFLKGPLIPIYGVGAILILVVAVPLQGMIWLEFVMGMLLATILEYLVGAVMESIFKVKYWDYSSKKIQMNGYICLSSSLAWGVLTVLLIEVMQREVEQMVAILNPNAWMNAVMVISFWFIYDSVTSAKEAWDLRIILTAVKRARQEMLEIQQLLEEKKEEIQLQLSYKMQSSKKVLDFIPKGTMAKDALAEKLEMAKANYKQLEHRLKQRNNGILKRNPDATSIRFKEVLENVLEHLERKK